ncbi:hypothetical protein PACID_07010 [Acidipropionibacterium acidipropionici ATCC 4875]|uniref:Uncharacterized protein n=1 Tax=Acidipropionibacterium acidipropionici (strain ATCC 4875 / DSM 20272 / JCM 6432 / NBRC 12425 / NCIMB 8070 / 4) TaxID=1171373 RepID=K7RKT2_ACIA4|nr:hypothetical protein PACID_07010 [Acidipropionibacterium acidipropionici ATCC 4875]
MLVSHREDLLRSVAVRCGCRGRASVSPLDGTTVGVAPGFRSFFHALHPDDTPRTPDVRILIFLLSGGLVGAQGGRGGVPTVAPSRRRHPPRAGGVRPSPPPRHVPITLDPGVSPPNTPSPSSGGRQDGVLGGETPTGSSQKPGPRVHG